MEDIHMEIDDPDLVPPPSGQQSYETAVGAASDSNSAKRRPQRVVDNSGSDNPAAASKQNQLNLTKNFANRRPQIRAVAEDEISSFYSAHSHPHNYRDRNSPAVAGSIVKTTVIKVASPSSLDMEEEATQPLTQPLPNHNGVAPSANSSDLSGVLCILHPNSPAAFTVAAWVEKYTPMHILHPPPAANPATYFEEEVGVDESTATESEQQVTPEELGCGDIALRYEPGPKSPTQGFIFGRNPDKCDVYLHETAAKKRISNMHFRIWMNPQGVLMLEDMSTNGTWVDDHKLGGTQDEGRREKCRVLSQGSIICLSPGAESPAVKFIVRIPKIEQTITYPNSSPSPEYSATPPIERGRLGPRSPPRIEPTAPRAARRNGLNELRRPPFTSPPTRKQDQMAMHTANARKTEPQWNGGGKYTLSDVLGKGAFALVQKAIVSATGEVFAVKIIARRAFTHRVGDKTEGVRKEVRILERLQHRNVVKYIECFEDAQKIYLVMEYVPGGDLKDYIAKHKYMKEELVKEVTRQVLSGIEFVHGMGISHRDLKPDNLLVMSQEPMLVKISDFGLAKMVDNEETFLTTFCGTMLYLAPEVFPGYMLVMKARYQAGMKRTRMPGSQAKARKDPRARNGHYSDDEEDSPDLPPQQIPKGKNEQRRYNQAVDMWSIGCVVHYLLTGTVPFNGANMDEMLNLITRGPPDMTNLRKFVGNNVVCFDFLTRLLQVKPTLRMMEQEALKHEWLDPQWDSFVSGPDDEVVQGVDYDDTDAEDRDRTITPKRNNKGNSISDGKYVRKSRQDDDGAGRNSGNNNPSKGRKVQAPQKAAFGDAQLRGAVEMMDVDDGPDTSSDEYVLPTPERRAQRGSSSEFSSDYVFEHSNGADGLSIIASNKHKVKPSPGVVVSFDGFHFSDDERASQESAQKSPRQNDPFEFDLPREGPGNLGLGAVPALIPPKRSASDDDDVNSLRGAESMVKQLKVALLSSKGHPIPQPRLSAVLNTANKAHLLPSPSVSSSFNVGALEFCTPDSLKESSQMKKQAPSRPGVVADDEDNSTPLSQPVNTLAHSAFVSPTSVPPSKTWGRIYPTARSVPHATYFMTEQKFKLGRSNICHSMENDHRISRYHFGIQLLPPGSPGDDREDNKNWRPTEDMYAWYHVLGLNGCYLNGQRKERGAWGRIFNNDRLIFFRGPDGILELVVELTVGKCRRWFKETKENEEYLKHPEPAPDVKIDWDVGQEDEVEDEVGGEVGMVMMGTGGSASTLGVKTPKPQGGN
ncbi:Protein kinase protein rad53 [Rhizina undulata]